MQIIIQARMNSTRLPNKVLYQINGKPLLKYLIERLTSIVEGELCIATSDHTKDDEIEDLCLIEKVPCFRGSLKDVANRILIAATNYKTDAFVRINGDSPLMDPKVIEEGIEIYQNGNYDLVTNVFPRSFPIGQSVEVIRTKTFEYVYEKMSSSDHFEHVTKYFYDNPDEFKIKNFKNDQDLNSYRLVVDTPEDLDCIKKIIGRMTRPHTEYSLDELIELYPSA